MKKFLNILLSDSNKLSMKRFIGLICLTMFTAYGIFGLIVPFNINFWIFYVSLCTITIWIAFKFMTADKILKYDVIGKLTKFAPLEQAVQGAMDTEQQLDNGIQPEQLSGDTTQSTTREQALSGQGEDPTNEVE